jgi:hypothetical protein
VLLHLLHLLLMDITLLVEARLPMEAHLPMHHLLHHHLLLLMATPPVQTRPILLLAQEVKQATLRMVTLLALAYLLVVDTLRIMTKLLSTQTAEPQAHKTHILQHTSLAQLQFVVIMPLQVLDLLLLPMPLVLFPLLELEVLISSPPERLVI